MRLSASFAASVSSNSKRLVSVTSAGTDTFQSSDTALARERLRIESRPMDLSALLIVCAVAATVFYWVVVRPQRHPRSLHERNRPDGRKRPF